MESKRKNVFEYSVGNCRRICCGHCIFGTHPYMFSFTICVIFIVPGLFIGLIALRLKDAVLSWSCASISILFIVASLSSFMCTACSDPGILARRRDSLTFPIRQHLFTVRGVEFVRKICSTCHIIRPVRSFHCGICDNCIEEHDHHCAWVNNCVGRRNHRPFVLFLLFSSIELLFQLIICVYAIVIGADTVEMIGAGLEIILSGMFGVFAVLMLFTQCSYICKGVTTNEVLRHKWEDIKNPFDEGCGTNCVEFFCSDTGPSIQDREEQDNPHQNYI